MANTLLTIAMITEEALMVLENNLTFTKQVTREYDDRFGVSGAKIGTVLQYPPACAVRLCTRPRIDFAGRDRNQRPFGAHNPVSAIVYLLVSGFDSERG